MLMPSLLSLMSCFVVIGDKDTIKSAKILIFTQKKSVQNTKSLS